MSYGELMRILRESPGSIVYRETLERAGKLRENLTYKEAEQLLAEIRSKKHLFKCGGNSQLKFMLYPENTTIALAMFASPPASYIKQRPLRWVFLPSEELDLIQALIISNMDLGDLFDHLYFLVTVTDEVLNAILRRLKDFSQWEREVYERVVLILLARVSLSQVRTVITYMDVNFSPKNLSRSMTTERFQYLAGKYAFFPGLSAEAAQEFIGGRRCKDLWLGQDGIYKCSRCINHYQCDDRYFDPIRTRMFDWI